MNTKLTITIEREIKEKAEAYAKKRRHSLSDIVGNYLKVLTKNENKQYDLTPIVRSLKGSFKNTGSGNYKKELEKELSKKYM